MIRKRPVKAATRHARAKREGIRELGGYDAVLAAQGGGCAICGRPPKVRKLNIDHAHITGEVRGLLCARCNRGLAWFLDAPDHLNTAAIYLKWGRIAACDYRDELRRLAALEDKRV